MAYNTISGDYLISQIKSLEDAPFQLRSLAVKYRNQLDTFEPNMRKVLQHIVDNFLQEGTPETQVLTGNEATDLEGGQPASHIGSADMSAGYSFYFNTQKFGLNINGEDSIVRLNHTHHTHNSLAGLIDNLNGETVGLPDGIEAFADGNNLGFRTTLAGSNQKFTTYNVPDEPAMAGGMYEFGYDWGSDPQDFKIAVNNGPLTTVNLTATATMKQGTIDVINSALQAAGLTDVYADVNPDDDRVVVLMTTNTGADARLDFEAGTNDALGTLRISSSYRTGTSGDFLTNVLGMTLSTYTGVDASGTRFETTLDADIEGGSTDVTINGVSRTHSIEQLNPLIVILNSIAYQSDTVTVLIKDSLTNKEYLSERPLIDSTN